MNDQAGEVEAVKVGWVIRRSLCLERMRCVDREWLEWRRRAAKLPLTVAIYASRAQIENKNN